MVRLRLGGLVFLVVAGSLVFAAGASAAPVRLCVPATAGAAVTSGGSTGTCASGSSPVALPSSSADQQTLISILPHIKYTASGVGAKPTVKFSGVNVQVISGSGATNGAVNGTGNVVVGYNEGTGTKGGSHNLILGRDQGYGSYGGLLGGRANVAGPYATALGYNNRATGFASTVTGGYSNRATNYYASVSGGCANLAGAGEFIDVFYCDTAGYFPTVGGGSQNQASGGQSSVTGGYQNQARGTLSSVSGGESNTASGDYASILGGFSSQATNSYASVSGGQDSTANGVLSSVSGGFNNVADGYGSSILGSFNKTAGGDYETSPPTPTP